MVKPFEKLFEILPGKDRLKFAALLFFMMIGTILEVIGIGLIPVFISAVAAPDILLDNQYLGPILELIKAESQKDLLLAGGLALVTVYLVKGGYITVLYYYKSKFIFGRFESIASRLYETYMFSPYTFFLERNSAEIIRNVTTETRHISEYVIQPSLSILMHGLTALGIFIFLLFVEPLITLVSFLILGIGGGGLMRILKKKMNYFGELASRERKNLIQGVNEGIGGFKDVTILNRQDYFIARFKGYVANLKQAEIFKKVSYQAVYPVIEVLAVGGMIIIAFTMVLQGRTIESIIPVLTLFGAATVRLMPAISQMLSEITTVKYYLHALKPVHSDITKLGKHLKRDKAAVTSEKLPFNKKIELKEVSFNYPGDNRKAIQEVSLQIYKGSAVAFVGASGSGKSTIIDLILGLLEPESGQILVDGTDIFKKVRKWQNNIGYVPQNIYLKDDTIRNNIAFGVPVNEISQQKIDMAIDAAQLQGLVENLEMGEDTMVGERGVRISGGERQRIGIARALYHNPEVLILDEATSALDTKTEIQVVEAIEKLKGKRTIIMIAHRHTSIMNCDRLYLVEDGRVINQGTYKQLFKESKIFRDLIQWG